MKSHFIKLTWNVDNLSTHVSKKWLSASWRRRQKDWSPNDESNFSACADSSPEIFVSQVKVSFVQCQFSNRTLPKLRGRYQPRQRRFWASPPGLRSVTQRLKGCFSVCSADWGESPTTEIWKSVRCVGEWKQGQTLALFMFMKMWPSHSPFFENIMSQISLSLLNLNILLKEADCRFKNNTWQESMV